MRRSPLPLSLATLAASVVAASLVAVPTATTAAAATSVATTASAKATARPATTSPAIVDSPILSSDIRDMAMTPDGTTYTVGYFSYVGAATGGLAMLDGTTGDVNRSFPAVVGSVYSMTEDGTGGWFIGGNFTAVGGVARSNLARINADLTIDDAFAPVINDTVRALHMTRGTLYVGGEFTTVNGSGHPYLAAFDGTTGVLDSWNPTLNAQVKAIASDDSAVYIGGLFSSIYGTGRSKVAALDPDSRALLSWNPGSNGDVYAVVVGTSAVYVGGGFTMVGGQSRNRLAALAPVASGDDTATAWNPNVGGWVRTIALDDSTVYAGGDFTTAGGLTRNRAAAFDSGTATTTAWNPNANGSVFTIAPTASGAFVGGLFGTIGGVGRSGVALTDAASGAVQSWNPRMVPNNTYNYAIADTGSGIVTGGSFSHVNVVSRKGGAAFDASGLVTAWDPQFNGGVNTFEVVGDTAYASGYFTTVGGTSRNRAAAVDLITGAVTAWNPNLDNWAEDLAIVGSTAYLVGEFNTVGGVTRRKAAAVRIDDAGTLTDWNPNLNYGGRAIAIRDNIAYIGGYFTTVGGVTRNRAAALTIDDTGTLTNWNPNANRYVNDILLDGDSAYLGGEFTSIGGVTRRSAAQVALDDSATLSSWNPDVDCPRCSMDFMSDPYVSKILRDGESIYLGGFFDTVGSYGGFTSIAVVSADDTGAVDLTWKPSLSSSVPDVYALAAASDGLRLGGYFSYVELNTIASTTNYGTLRYAASIPSAPTSVSANAGNASASVAWTVPNDGHSAITRVEFALDDTTVVADSTASTSSPHTINGLTNGRNYTVYVRLVNAVGTGPWSVASAAFTPVAPTPAPPPAPIAPGAPADVTVTAGDASATVTWSAPASTGSFPVMNYRVIASPGGQSCLTASMTCAFDGLTNGTEYTFSVQALNGAGWGPAAMSNTVTPEASPTPPPPPEATVITITGSRAKGNSRQVRIEGQVSGGSITAVQPYYRIGGRRGERASRNAAPVREDGSFTWKRRTSRRISIYVVAGDVASNTVTIRARR